MKKRSTLKRRLGVGFVKAMKKVAVISVGAGDNKEKRRRAIRGAAYASMASVIGPRKAWSRAILMKKQPVPRQQRRHDKYLEERGRNPRRNEDELGEELRDLSEVVPGGRGMDSWKLLNETAHYIKCLRAQVQIMTTILHHSAAPST